MSIKRQIQELMPRGVKRGLRIRHDRKELGRLRGLDCKVGGLRSVGDFGLREMLASRELETRWNEAKGTTERFVVPDGTDGVNPGDRRVIFYLVSTVKPRCVLEIGTHIGASTLHIASALFVNQEASTAQPTVVTVDIADVNDPVSKPWLKSGAGLSPREMIDAMNCEARVEFVNERSLEYFARCDSGFDFVFLDGDHSAETVYQEVPAALNVLNDSGMILLHDYFPNLKPLWSNGSVIPGPFLATERLREEGASIVVVPLGKLRWPTKLQSNVTSLAVLFSRPLNKYVGQAFQPVSSLWRA